MDYKKIAEWALCGKTGSSSKFMAGYLAGFSSENQFRSHPSDGGDFERCLGLLDAVPELRNHLDKMKSASPYWKALVENWSEIESASDDKRYNMMKSLLRPIEKEDMNTMSFGEGASICFGGFIKRT